MYVQLIVWNAVIADCDEIFVLLDNNSSGSGYLMPSQEIADIVDVPSVPLLSISPDRKLVSCT